jgi:hypothetical protein
VVLLLDSELQFQMETRSIHLFNEKIKIIIVLNTKLITRVNSLEYMMNWK